MSPLEALVKEHERHWDGLRKLKADPRTIKHIVGWRIHEDRPGDKACRKQIDAMVALGDLLIQNPNDLVCRLVGARLLSVSISAVRDLLVLSERLDRDLIDGLLVDLEAKIPWT